MDAVGDCAHVDDGELAPHWAQHAMVALVQATGLVLPSVAALDLPKCLSALGAATAIGSSSLGESVKVNINSGRLNCPPSLVQAASTVALVLWPVKQSVRLLPFAHHHSPHFLTPSSHPSPFLQ